MGFLKYLLGTSLPKEGNVVRMKDTSEIGTVVRVTRDTGGIFFESFCTCKIRFADGSEREYKENEFVKLNL